jgi:hypothetical protein
MGAISRLGAGRKSPREGTEVAAPGRKPSARHDRMSEGAQSDSEALEEGHRGALMLPRVTDAAGREHGEQARAGSRRTSFVHGDGVRLEPDLESGITDAPADIEILAVEEETLVEAAQTLENRAPDQQARSRRPLRRPGMPVGLPVAYELVGPFRLREETMEEERLRVGGAETREAALREVEGAVVGHDLRGDRADPGSVLRGANQPPERLCVDRGVGIEKEREGRVSFAPTDVTGVREATVLGEPDDGDRKIGNALDRRIRRCAVHDDHPNLGDVRERLDARAKVILAVVGDDDDVDLGHPPNVPADRIAVPPSTTLSGPSASVGRDDGLFYVGRG